MNVDLRPAVEIAKKAVDTAISRILSFSDISRNQGLLVVIPYLDKKALKDRNNLFEYGISMVCYGYDAEIIKEILQNIQKLKECDDTQKLIDTLYIIGVLGVQRGDNPMVLVQWLDARIPESHRSDQLKERITEINLCFVNEDKFPRVYLRPEEAATEFEKIAALTDKQIQIIMREVDTDTLVQAVWENERMKNVFYHNMSSRAAEMMEFDIKYDQEARTRSAQNRIIQVARNLAFIE
jgi:hypothetical protein